MKELKQKFDRLDPQRDRVYAAELAVWPREKGVKLTLEDLQKELDQIQSTAWFKKAYPDVGELSVEDGRGSPWSRISYDSIQLIRVSRVLDVLIHELMHQVMPPGLEWHGAVFCGMLLFFTGKIYGMRTKDRLRRAFKRRKIVYDHRIARFGDMNRNGKENE